VSRGGEQPVTKSCRGASIQSERMRWRPRLTYQDQATSKICISKPLLSELLKTKGILADGQTRNPLAWSAPGTVVDSVGVALCEFGWLPTIEAHTTVTAGAPIAKKAASWPRPPIAAIARCSNSMFVTPLGKDGGSRGFACHWRTNDV
jgi:hypothetical protein